LVLLVGEARCDRADELDTERPAVAVRPPSEDRGAGVPGLAIELDQLPRLAAAADDQIRARLHAPVWPARRRHVPLPPGLRAVQIEEEIAASLEVELLLAVDVACREVVHDHAADVVERPTGDAIRWKKLAAHAGPRPRAYDAL